MEIEPIEHENLPEPYQEVGIQYLVNNAKETEFLEGAIKAFPALLTVHNLPEFGDRASIYVMKSMNADELRIRPYKCDISDVVVTPEVELKESIGNFDTFEYEGITFNIFRERLYGI